MEEMTIPIIISFVTVLVTYIFAEISKKFNWLESKYIPYQNAVIGIIAGIIAWKVGLAEDIATAIILCIISAFGAGGGYDFVKQSKEGVDEK